MLSRSCLFLACPVLHATLVLSFFLSRKLESLRKWECVLGNDGEGEDGGVLTLSDVQIKGKERQLPRAYARMYALCETTKLVMGTIGAIV